MEALHKGVQGQRCSLSNEGCRFSLSSDARSKFPVSREVRKHGAESATKQSKQASRASRPAQAGKPPAGQQASKPGKAKHGKARKEEASFSVHVHYGLLCALQMRTGAPSQETADVHAVTAAL